MGIGRLCISARSVLFKNEVCLEEHCFGRLLEAPALLLQSSRESCVQHIDNPILTAAAFERAGEAVREGLVEAIFQLMVASLTPILADVDHQRNAVTSLEYFCVGLHLF